MASRPCAIDGCPRPAGVPGTARGWCSGHYQKWRQYGDPLHELPPRATECSVGGCTKSPKARGWCGAHWALWRTHGTPEPRRRGEVRDGRRICPRCRQDVLLTEFGRHAGKPAETHCRACTRQIAAEWRVANPSYVQPRPSAEVRAAEARAYRRRHPERAAEIARSAHNRRRAQKLAVPAEQFRHVEIFERDDWVCQICQEPIDRTAKAPHPLSPSLDHRRPLARGGDHTRANCQAAHLRCNVRKHAKWTEAA